MKYNAENKRNCIDSVVFVAIEYYASRKINVKPTNWSPTSCNVPPCTSHSVLTFAEYSLSDTFEYAHNLYTTFQRHIIILYFGLDSPLHNTLHYRVDLTLKDINKSKILFITLLAFFKVLLLILQYKYTLAILLFIIVAICLLISFVFLFTNLFSFPVFPHLSIQDERYIIVT